MVEFNLKKFNAKYYKTNNRWANAYLGENIIAKRSKYSTRQQQNDSELEYKSV